MEGTLPFEGYTNFDTNADGSKSLRQWSRLDCDTGRRKLRCACVRPGGYAWGRAPVLPDGYAGFVACTHWTRPNRPAGGVFARALTRWLQDRSTAAWHCFDVPTTRHTPHATTAATRSTNTHKETPHATRSRRSPPPTHRAPHATHQPVPTRVTCGCGGHARHSSAALLQLLTLEGGVEIDSLTRPQHTTPPHRIHLLPAALPAHDTEPRRRSDHHSDGPGHNERGGDEDRDGGRRGCGAASSILQQTRPPYAA